MLARMDLLFVGLLKHKYCRTERKKASIRLLKECIDQFIRLYGNVRPDLFYYAHKLGSFDFCKFECSEAEFTPSLCHCVLHGEKCFGFGDLPQA